MIKIDEPLEQTNFWGSFTFLSGREARAKRQTNGSLKLIIMMLYFNNSFPPPEQNERQISPHNLWSFQLWKRNYDETIYGARADLLQKYAATMEHREFWKLFMPPLSTDWITFPIKLAGSCCHRKSSQAEHFASESTAGGSRWKKIFAYKF